MMNNHMNNQSTPMAREARRDLRPTPLFYTDHSFATKKSRSITTPSAKKVPPRPPSKSVPPVSRLFPSYDRYKAKAISFNENNDSSLSKFYDESREESYFEQCFTIESKLGSGSFGDVFKVRCKEDGKYYAIKRSRERFKGRSDRERKLEEVCKYEQLPKHPNCVRLFKAWEEQQHLYIQTELCESSLSQYAEDNHDIPEKVIWNYLIDLLKAVGHLHEHDLIHLDIKPENIFIANDGTCKLGDFGLVLDLRKNDSTEATEGDPKYLAKELMQAIFTKAADVFSLGITILELACDLDLPSGGQGWHQLRDGIIPDQLSNVSPELKEIITWMMHHDYKKRPTARQLLQHPTISKINKRRVIQLTFRRSMISLKKYISLFMTSLLKVLFLVGYPFIAIKRRLSRSSSRTGMETPPPSLSVSRYSEGNYSDDDVFDSTHNNLSPINILNESSSSSNDGKITYNDWLSNSCAVSPRPYCSTAMTTRHRNIFEDALHSPTFKTSSPIARTATHNSSVHESPIQFKESYHPKIVSQKLNFCDIEEDADDDDDSLDWNNKSAFNIGPKNLLSTFEEIDNSDDEET